jgi:putative tricarboxylic transport membrane protein
MQNQHALGLFCETLVSQSKTAPRLVGSAVLLTALFFGIGLQYVDAQGGYAGLSPRFLATVVTIGLSICGFLIFFKKDSVFSESEDAGTAINTEARFKRLAILVGGLIAHLVAIGLVGFVIASGLLMAVVAYAYGNQRIMRNLLIGIAIALPIWALFTQVLGLNLPIFPLLSALKL